MCSIISSVSSDSGVVEVDLGALDGGQVGQVAVVGVVRQVGNAVRADALQNDVGDGGLAGTGAAGDADDDGGFKGGHGEIIPLAPDKEVAAIWTLVEIKKGRNGRFSQIINVNSRKIHAHVSKNSHVNDKLLARGMVSKSGGYQLNRGGSMTG